MAVALQDVAVLRDVRRDARITRFRPTTFRLRRTSTVAHRTSPTNIGMGLLATLAAHDFGFIDTDELARRIDATLTTVEGLERFEGHLLNWYDTRDAGAAAARLHLDRRQRQPRGRARDAVRGLGAAARVGAGLDERAPRRAGARATRCSTSMNFSFLYDTQRQLFTIGYRLADDEGPGPARPVRTTTCWPPKRDWPAFSRSPRATCPNPTGSIWDEPSRACGARRCCCRGAPRCSSI